MPLLADPLSGARRGPAAIAHYDALLRSPSFAASVQPELVLRVGDLPTSKPLRAWLAASDALQVSFDPEAAWQDPDGSVGTILAADPRATFDGARPRCCASAARTRRGSSAGTRRTASPRARSPRRWVRS